MSRSRVASEALQWVIWIQTSRSIDRLWPTFQNWLQADRENWVAYLRARRQWSRWDRLEALLWKDRQTIEKTLAVIERRRQAARSHRDVLWFLLGISVLSLMLV